jgi:hypothetical protein
VRAGFEGKVRNEWGGGAKQPDENSRRNG